jgi:hypothetical protein
MKAPLLGLGDRRPSPLFLGRAGVLRLPGRGRNRRRLYLWLADGGLDGSRWLWVGCVALSLVSNRHFPFPLGLLQRSYNCQR